MTQIKTNTAWLISWLIVASVTLLLPQRTLAQEQQTWQFLVAPYLWSTGIDGTVGIGGRDADVDLSFDDLLEFVDIAGGLRFEAVWNRWGFFGDIWFASLSDEESILTGEVEIDFDQTVAEAGAIYRIKPPLDIYFGVRYQDLDGEIRFPVIGTLKDGKDWTDFIVGARYAPQLSKRCRLVLRGDIGGGDSDSVWLAQVSGVYRFTKHWSVDAGYR